MFRVSGLGFRVERLIFSGPKSTKFVVALSFNIPRTSFLSRGSCMLGFRV